MELSERLPRRYTAGPNDVFAIVKQNMCDSDPCQPALLVFPGDEATQVKRFWATSVGDRGEDPQLEPDRKSDLIELADCFATYPNFGRAVSYLKALAGQGNRTRYEAHALPFLQSGGVHSPGLLCANLPPRNQGPPPHPLRVRFHRP